MFFYVLYPESGMINEDTEWLENQIKPVADRVTLVRYPTKIRDRMEEHYKFSSELYRLACPDTDNGLWDADVVLTSRIAQIPMFKTASSRSVGFEGGSYRGVIGLDEMPIFPFRETVSWGTHMSLHSMNAYLMSDGVIVNNLWTKKKIQEEARKHLSPSNIKKLMGKIDETVPVELKPLHLKSNVKPLKDVCNVLFCGRMTGTRNFKGVLALFRKQFSYTVGKKVEVKFKVSTQSMSTGSAIITDDKFVEYVQNNREAFYNMLKTGADVVVNLSGVEDFSLSTYEPMLYGVPVIVPNKDWTSFLGKDYPYRAATEVEAYAMINEAVANYPRFYKRFADWHQSYWISFVESMQGDNTTEKLDALLRKHEAKLRHNFSTKLIGGIYRVVVDKIVSTKQKKINILDIAREYGLSPKVDLRKVPVGKMPNLIVIKHLLQNHGYKDTNETGVMIKGAKK